MKKPEIDLTICVLCEICTDYSPLVFKLNAAGFVEVVDLEKYPEADINEVIKNCRGDCIFWVESEYCISAKQLQKNKKESC